MLSGGRGSIIPQYERFRIYTRYIRHHRDAFLLTGTLLPNPGTDSCRLAFPYHCPTIDFSVSRTPILLDYVCAVIQISSGRSHRRSGEYCGLVMTAGKRSCLSLQGPARCDWQGSERTNRPTEWQEGGLNPVGTTPRITFDKPEIGRQGRGRGAATGAQAPTRSTHSRSRWSRPGTVVDPSRLAQRRWSR